MVNALRERIRVRMEKRQYETALQDANRLMVASHDDAGWYTCKGEILLRLKKYPELIEWVSEDLLSLPDSLPGAGLLKKVILLIKSMTLPHTAHLLEAFRDQAEYSVISQLAALPVNIPDDGLVTEFQGAIIALEGVGMDHAIDLFLSKAKETGLSAEEKKSLQALIARRKK